MMLNRHFSLNKEAFLNKKGNYHTHTGRCNHAVGEDRDYVEAAIRAGFDVLGFSDHTPYPFGKDFVSPYRMTLQQLPGYVDSVLRLKEEYKHDIQILLGLETEYYPEYFGSLTELLSEYPLDYMIMGQHCVGSEVLGTFVSRPTDDTAFLEAYVNQVIEGIHTGYFVYLAHPDMIHYTGDTASYVRCMRKLAEEMKVCGIPVEVNVNGYRGKRNYPNRTFLDIALETGNDFVVGIDAHAPGELCDSENYLACIRLIESRGGTVLNAGNERQ